MHGTELPIPPPQSVVETQGLRTLGRTVIDTRTHAPEPPNCHVAFGADARRFVELLLEVFAGVAIRTSEE
jgi:inosine-uridine nucleoside N-ribohydrolase